MIPRRAFVLAWMAGSILLVPFGRTRATETATPGTVTIDDAASGTKIETPVELHLEQKEGVLSGKMGREHDPDKVEIRNAKVEGDTLTFEASSQETSSSMRFSLKVRGEQMLGDMKGAADGNDIVAKVSLTRAK